MTNPSIHSSLGTSHDPSLDHEMYGMYCALAATGQLSEEERTRLDAHCQECLPCRERLARMASVGRRLMLQVAMDAEEMPIPAGHLERFIKRAHHQGIAVRSPHIAGLRWPSAFHAWVPVLSALAFFSVMLNFATHVGPGPAKGLTVSDGVTSLHTDVSTAAHLESTAGSHEAKHRTVSRARHSMGVTLALVKPVALRSQGASLAPERFTQAIPAEYPFFKSSAAPVSSAYPALSSANVPGLEPFFNSQAPSKQATLGVATLYRPDTLPSLDRSFDFAAGIRQLRFQLPTTQ